MQSTHGKAFFLKISAKLSELERTSIEMEIPLINHPQIMTFLEIHIKV